MTEPLLSSLVSQGGDRATIVAEGERWLVTDLLETGSRLYSPSGETGTAAAVLSNDRPSLELLLGAVVSGVPLVSLPAPSRAMGQAGYAALLRRICQRHGITEVVASDETCRGLAATADVGVELRPHSMLQRRPLAAPSDQGFQLVQFSSGSTGDPKGIKLENSALGANVQAILDVLQLRPGDRGVSWLPISHDMGLVGMLFTSIAAGASRWAGDVELVLCDPESFVRRPGSWMAAAAEHRATITAAPNFALRLAARRPPPAQADVSALRCLIVGGEIIQPDALRGFQQAMAANGFDPLALCPAYGLAEFALAVTMTRPAEPWAETAVALDGDPGHEVSAVACGAPLPGYEVSVERNAEQPASGVAPLSVRGPSVGLDPASAERLGDSDGWVGTGDIGCIQEGQIYVLGRHDDHIVAAGRKFHAPALESAVQERVPGVRSGRAAVVSLPGGDWAIVAEVTAPGRRTSAELRRMRNEISQTCVQEMGGKPDHVVLAAPRSIPFTSSGKLRRRQLALAVNAGEVAPLPAPSGEAPLG